MNMYLTGIGIETMLSWGGRGVHQFKNLGLTKFHLPRTDRLFERVLLLPMNPELTNEEIEYIVEGILKFYKNN